MTTISRIHDTHTVKAALAIIPLDTLKADLPDTVGILIGRESGRGLNCRVLGQCQKLVNVRA